MTSMETSRQLYNEIREYIRDAREITERGEFIELERLNGRVEKLCDSVHGLKVEEAVKFHDDLQELMKELGELQEIFIARRNGLADELTDVGRHKHAARAYRQQEVVSAREASAKEKNKNGSDE